MVQCRVQEGPPRVLRPEPYPYISHSSTLFPQHPFWSTWIEAALTGLLQNLTTAHMKTSQSSLTVAL
jgi:hypothetical protein